MFFACPVYVVTESEKSLILSEPFVSDRLILGGHHYQGVITGSVRWYKGVACLRQLVFRGNGEHKVAVPAYSKVQHHRFNIPTY